MKQSFLPALLAAGTIGGLVGCTLDGVAYAPSASVTRYTGDLDSFAGTVGMTAYPAPEVAAPRADTFRPTQATAPPPTGGAVQPATGYYDWPGYAGSPSHDDRFDSLELPGSVAPVQGESPRQSEVERHEIETPWGRFVITGAASGAIAALAIALALFLIQRKKEQSE